VGPGVHAVSKGPALFLGACTLCCGCPWSHALSPNPLRRPSPPPALPTPAQLRDKGHHAAGGHRQRHGAAGRGGAAQARQHPRVRGPAAGQDQRGGGRQAAGVPRRLRGGGVRRLCRSGGRASSCGHVPVDRHHAPRPPSRSSLRQRRTRRPSCGGGRGRGEGARHDSGDALLDSGGSGVAGHGRVVTAPSHPARLHCLGIPHAHTADQRRQRRGCARWRRLWMAGRAPLPRSCGSRRPT
jgi:hypothetical protein